MTKLSRRAFAALIAASAVSTSFLATPAWSAETTINIGYQPIVEPSRVPQADGTYEKATKAKINWQKFDGGADVIAAIASGSIDIGYVGSSPLAAAASRQLPIETIALVGLISEAKRLPFEELPSRKI